jgi:hypothetical protein
MHLTAEQIQDNYARFIANIETYVSSPRKEKLIDYYKSIEDHLVLAPAAIRNTNHNCLPGGYVDHVNRVVEASLRLHDLWQEFGNSYETYTLEELVFAAINHDLGKLGLKDKPGVLENDNDWQVKNQGALYKINTELMFSTVPDRSLFILQSAGIAVSENEYLGIKLHDGLYDESNKPYLVSFQTESRLRTTLPIILHQADLLASRVEWERDWLPKLSAPQKAKPKQVRLNSEGAKKEAMAKLGKSNPALANLLKTI